MPPKKLQRMASCLVRDSDGEKGVREVGARLRAAGRVFEDPEFPAEERILFANPETPGPT